jgi:aerobic carbon-monoxide dehydrogenase medium subunit
MRSQARGAGLIADSQWALEPFELVRPATVAEAVAAHERRPGAVFAAGMTDLTAQFREGLRPSACIALSGLDELRRVRVTADGLRIGALLTHRAGPADETLRTTLPSLARAWGRIANVRVRFRATIGGNLMARRHRYEIPVILSALDAELCLSDARGEHRLPVAALGRGESVPGGLLTEIGVETRSLAWFGYDRSLRPVTTVAVAVRRVAGGLAVTSCAGSEYRPAATVSRVFAVAEPAELDPREVGAALAGALPDSIGDYAGSARYRRRVVGTLIARQLRTASEENRS